MSQPIPERPTTTTPNSTPADAVLVAIDIAKARNEVLIEAPKQKRRRRLQVLNNRSEHDRLIEALQAYGRSVVCGFEATGNYHRPIAWRLAEAGFDVRLVSRAEWHCVHLGSIDQSIQSCIEWAGAPVF